MAAGNITVGHYRFRNDDGSESTASWIAAEDTVAGATITADTNFRLRLALKTNTNSVSDAYHLGCSHNGGTVFNVSSSSNYVKGIASSHLTDGGNTTQQLTVDGGYTFQTEAGVVSQTGATSGTISTNDTDDFEVEWSLVLTFTDLANTDTLDFTLRKGGGIESLTQFGSNIRLTITITGTITVSQWLPIAPSLLPQPRKYVHLIQSFTIDPKQLTLKERVSPDKWYVQPPIAPRPRLPSIPGAGAYSFNPVYFTAPISAQFTAFGVVNGFPATIVTAIFNVQMAAFDGTRGQRAFYQVYTSGGTGGKNVGLTVFGRNVNATMGGFTASLGGSPPNPPTAAKTGNLYFAQAKDQNGITWTDEVVVDENVALLSAGCVWMGDGYGILYTKTDGTNSDAVWWITTPKPNDWTVNLPSNTGQRGHVAGLAINKSGVIMALMQDGKTFVSRNRGTTWIATHSVSSGLTAQITSQEDAFIVVKPDGDAALQLKHYISLDAGVSWK